MIGLLVGLAIPYLANPRMGLSSHLEGVMNGMLLLILGLIWDKLALGNRGLTWVYWLSLFSTYANLTATFLAAVWGAGKMMPIAAGNSTGTGIQEALISTLLVSLSLAVIAVFALVFLGLSKAQKAN
ncbi:hydrogenase [bacterium]|nr:hydrogenase [bacterium]